MIKNKFINLIENKINKKIIEKNDIKTTNLSSIHENNKLQTIELKKFQTYYNITKKQLIKYYNLVKKENGYILENLLKKIESRIDYILFSSNFSKSINMSRQLINHGHICINDKKIKFPNILCKNNDKICLYKNIININNIINMNIKNNLNKIPNHLKISTNQDGKYIILFSNNFDFNNIIYSSNIDYIKIIEFCSLNK